MLLPCQKPHFQLPDDEHYLNCAYMAPIPRRRWRPRAWPASAREACAVAHHSGRLLHRSGDGARALRPAGERRPTRRGSPSFRPRPTGWPSPPATCRRLAARTSSSPTSSSRPTCTPGASWPRRAGVEHARGACRRRAAEGRGRGWNARVLEAIDRQHGHRRHRPRALDRRHAVRSGGDRRPRPRGRRRAGRRRDAVGGRAAVRRRPRSSQTRSSSPPTSG